MARETFRAWLAWQAWREDPVGDLARDVEADRRDGCLRAWSAYGIFCHMRDEHGATDEALTALNVANLWYERETVPEVSRA